MLRAFGAVSQWTDTGFKLTAEVGRLKGAVVQLTYPSVGATEQFLLGAVVAAGDSELRNAAIEPEIIDLISMLQRMGALITVQPDRIIQVTGVSRLRGFRTLPYRTGLRRLPGRAWHWRLTDGLLCAASGNVLAALAAQGDSTVTGVSLLDRGYENFREKLIGVGAKLR